MPDQDLVLLCPSPFAMHIFLLCLVFNIFYVKLRYVKYQAENNMKIALEIFSNNSLRKVSRLSPSTIIIIAQKIANKLSLFYCCLTKHLHSMLKNEIETFQFFPPNIIFCTEFEPRGFEAGCAQYKKKVKLSLLRRTHETSIIFS